MVSDTSSYCSQGKPSEYSSASGFSQLNAAFSACNFLVAFQTSPHEVFTSLDEFAMEHSGEMWSHWITPNPRTSQPHPQSHPKGMQGKKKTQITSKEQSSPSPSHEPCLLFPNLSSPRLQQKPYGHCPTHDIPPSIRLALTREL